MAVPDFCQGAEAGQSHLRVLRPAGNGEGAAYDTGRLHGGSASDGGPAAWKAGWKRHGDTGRRVRDGDRAGERERGNITF